MRLLGVLLMVLALHPRPAHAAFVGLYDPANFTSTFLNSDGTAVLDGGGALVVTGGNNGSGDPGTFRFLIQATLAGMVSFNWSYLTLDTPNVDSGGYHLAGNYFMLGDLDGLSGSVSFNVGVGDWFGFQMETSDNTGEPGVLTISNFNAPVSGAVIPEPGTWMLGVAGLAALAAGARLRRTSS